MFGDTAEYLCPWCHQPVCSCLRPGKVMFYPPAPTVKGPEIVGVKLVDGLTELAEDITALTYEEMREFSSWWLANFPEGAWDERTVADLMVKWAKTKLGR
jgi:hypothetical protein